jgi:hypothetical protein
VRRQRSGRLGRLRLMRGGLVRWRCRRLVCRWRRGLWLPPLRWWLHRRLCISNLRRCFRSRLIAHGLRGLGCGPNALRLSARGIRLSWISGYHRTGKRRHGGRLHRLRQLVNQPEGAGNGLERVIDGRVLAGADLQCGERLARGGQCGRSGLRGCGAVACLDPVQRAHGVRDGLGYGHQLRRDTRALQRTKASSKIFTRSTGCRNGVGHPNSSRSGRVYHRGLRFQVLDFASKDFAKRKSPGLHAARGLRPVRGDRARSVRRSDRLPSQLHRCHPTTHVLRQSLRRPCGW